MSSVLPTPSLSARSTSAADYFKRALRQIWGKCTLSCPAMGHPLEDMGADLTPRPRLPRPGDAGSDFDRLPWVRIGSAAFRRSGLRDRVFREDLLDPLERLFRGCLRRHPFLHDVDPANGPDVLVLDLGIC